jgi:pimeloyl-ACP methyl ester carboxylesterase
VRHAIRKIFKYGGIAILCLVLALILYRAFLQHKAAKERAITSRAGIDSLEPVRIGGIDQWVEVRGQNVDNPILLVIHGGPGIAFIPLAGAFQGSWEKYFTVAEWDQRGAGKTYASNDKDLQRRTMHVPQMEEDTLDVVNYLRNRFHREKIFVLAHSWGSLLGLWLAHEHPDLIYAYVGVGQVLNPKQNDDVAYRDATASTRNAQRPSRPGVGEHGGLSKCGFAKRAAHGELASGATGAAAQRSGVYGYEEASVGPGVGSRVFSRG